MTKERLETSVDDLSAKTRPAEFDTSLSFRSPGQKCLDLPSLFDTVVPSSRDDCPRMSGRTTYGTPLDLDQSYEFSLADRISQSSKSRQQAISPTISMPEIQDCGVLSLRKRAAMSSLVDYPCHKLKVDTRLMSLSPQIMR